MQKLNANGKLVLSALLALTTALPLACSSDDSKGIPPAGDAGEAGEGGADAKGGAGGKAGAGGKGGGSAQAGNAQGGASAGSAGAPEAGSPEMGGEGGTTEPMGGAAGVEEMGGAGGDSSQAAYEANLEATCTTEGSLDCSGNGAASDKQDCIDLGGSLADAYPVCFPQQKALYACTADKAARTSSASRTPDRPPSRTRVLPRSPLTATASPLNLYRKSIFSQTGRTERGGVPRSC